MAYSNATFYINLEGGSDAARAALTSVAVANNGAGLVRCTKTAHGLVTGAVGDATLNYAGAWQITVIDANNFDLIGSTYSTATALTFTPRGGSSKADAWLTFLNGATAARTQPGDTMRIMAAPNPTLIGSATWTDQSKVITLSGAVTANISDCETAWTASANVTATTYTTYFKEGTHSASIAIAAAFTTGLAAYFPTGALDLSGYQQVSFWIFCSAAVPVSTLSLRLCSDAAGVTTVHTIPIPAINNSVAGYWMPVTVDLGSAMSASIASVALYCDLDPGTVNVYFDNILACKASSSADSLSLTSLIGKVWNLSWVASTAYAANDIRKPTQPNRNGFRYKVTAGGGGSSGSSEPTWPQEMGVTVADGALTWTCEGLEDTWYGLQSINGTTVKLDNINPTLGSAGRGYGGTSETVATYKREAIRQAVTDNTNYSSTTAINVLQEAGSFASPITYSGGWNRTDMSTQTGETWVDGQNGWGGVMYAGTKNFVTVKNVSGVRYYAAFYFSGGSGLQLYNCHANHCSSYGINISNAAGNFYAQGLVGNNDNVGVTTAGSSGTGVAWVANNTLQNFSYVITTGGGSNTSLLNISYLGSRNNDCSNGVISASVSNIVRIGNLMTQGNTAGMAITGRGFSLYNASLSEATPFVVASDVFAYVSSTKHQQTAGNHLLQWYGGTIASAVDQRHTASGISWKFKPTATTRDPSAPLVLPVAKVAVGAGTLVTMSIWTYRDNANIQGAFRVRGGQIGGVPVDLTVACAPTINTWVQSGNLTFTPSEAGVVEVEFLVWDGVGTTNNFWIDDFAVTQA